MWFHASRPVPPARVHADAGPSSLDIPLRTLTKASTAQRDPGVEAVAQMPGQTAPKEPWLVRHRIGLRACLSAGLGAGITAGTTYALVRHVHHAVATAKIRIDPVFWANQARTLVYDACYDGCDDCNDVNFAYDACQKTTLLQIPNVVCDANTMWNWRERYPAPCLDMLGNMLRGAALQNHRQHDRDTLALIILTVGAGIAGGAALYLVTGHMASRWGAAQTQQTAATDDRV